jgi:hypothetical protein
LTRLNLTLLSLTLLRLALLSPIGLGLRAGLLVWLSLAGVARGLLSLPTLG